MNSTVLTFKSLIIIGLTSGFFSAILTTLCNLLMTKINNKNAHILEKNKYIQSKNDYRYKELSKHLENIIDVITAFDSSWKSQMDEYNTLPIELSIEHFDKINSYLDKIYPLLDSCTSNQVKEMYHKVLNYELQYLDHIKDDNSNTYASELFIQILDFNGKLTKIVQEQLIKLIQ